MAIFLSCFLLRHICPQYTHGGSVDLALVFLMLSVQLFTHHLTFIVKVFVRLDPIEFASTRY
jgi:hypothetical protein